jgi:hypothetical protein
VVGQLVRAVALDLETFSSDRERRNRASYRPSRLIPVDLEAERSLEIATDVWTSLEPDRQGGFPHIDAALLKSVLTQTYSSVFDPNDEGATITWDSWIDQSTPTSEVGSAIAEAIKDQRHVYSSNRLLEAAFEADPDEIAPDAFFEGMVARAALILRLASGSALALIGESGGSITQVRPWVESLAGARGLWDASDPPDFMTDLWHDNELAIQSLISRKADLRHSFLQSAAPEVLVLGQTERVPAWTFA